MADGLNRVMLLGNLGQDPDLRMSQSGTAVLKLRLACQERYQDSNRTWQERTEWVSCVVFGKRAEALGKFLAKGSKIYLEGSLRTSSYEDRDGNKRYRTEVIANNIILCGGRSNSSAGKSPTEDTQRGGSGSVGYDDADYGVGGAAEDDIPF